MKKTLLTTTALIAAFVATDAQAGSLQVNVGGYADFQAGYVSDDIVDTGADENTSTNFNTDSELHVSVEGSADNGLEYGAVLELEVAVTDSTDVYNNGDTADKAYLFVQGGWGRVELGENTGAEEALAVNTASFASATGGVEGDFYRYAAVPAGFDGITRPQLILAESGDSANTNEDATKITYYSPRFSGFQLGASYIANTGDTARTGSIAATTTATDFENTFTGGVNYSGQFDEVGVTASLTGLSGDAKDSAATADLEGYAAGANLTYAGFTVGASYGDYLDTFGNGVDATYYDLGLGYTTGALSTSVTYLDSEQNGDDFSNLVFGADYALAPGLTPYAEVALFEYDGAGTGTANDNDGTVFVLGTELSF